VTGASHTVSKVRCITLNYNASKMVHFKVIRGMLLGDEDPVVNVHTEHIIKRKRKGTEQ